MANAIYPKAKEDFISKAIDMVNDSIKVVLVDSAGGTGYTPTLATDHFLSIIPALARVATSSALGSKTVALGVFDAADITFTAVSGAQSEYLVGYDDTPAGDGAKNLVWIDDTATGLPVTPGGGDISVTWDNGASRIFAL